MSQYDDIVIGAGHNGLICANYLALTGRKVLIIEASEDIGGLARRYQFHPRFHTSVAQTLNQFSEKVARDLQLEKYGCTFATQSVAETSLSSDGKHIRIDGESITGVSTTDALQFANYRAMTKQFARLLAPFWLKTIPRIGLAGIRNNLTFVHLGLKLRLLGKRAMGEFMRVATLPTRDLMDEYFDSEPLKALLSWDALLGSRMAPRSPNGSIMTLLYKMSGKNEGVHYLPQSGGLDALVESLRKSAEAAGVKIRTNTPVSTIIIEGTHQGQTATGVQLTSGEIIYAQNIVSAIDPKRTFLDLVGAAHLDIEFTNRISRLRTDGLVAKLHLALDGLPEFNGLQRPDGRLLIAPTQDAIEFAYDDAKYGYAPEKPVIEMFVPSLYDSDMAPEGSHVLSANIMYVPYTHRTGWNGDNKDALYQTILNEIEQYVPNIRKHIVHGELLTPEDIEHKFNVTGGHWHHGELSMWQMLMMRPTYEAAQYATPITGLYLCSAGCHPGGGISGAAGHNAAQQILKANR